MSRICTVTHIDSNDNKNFEILRICTVAHKKTQSDRGDPAYVSR
jgi:hypothetical protein